jgi:hypothetical protein
MPRLLRALSIFSAFPSVLLQLFRHARKLTENCRSLGSSKSSSAEVGASAVADARMCTGSFAMRRPCGVHRKPRQKGDSSPRWTAQWTMWLRSHPGPPVARHLDLTELISPKLRL